MITLDRPAQIALDWMKAEDRQKADRAFAIIECFSEGDAVREIRKVSMPDAQDDFYVVEQDDLSFLFQVHGDCKQIVDITATARLEFFQRLHEVESHV